MIDDILPQKLNEIRYIMDTYANVLINYVDETSQNYYKIETVPSVSKIILKKKIYDINILKQ